MARPQQGPGGDPWVKSIPDDHVAYKTRSVSGFGRRLMASDLPTRLHYSTEGTAGNYGFVAYIPPHVVYEESMKALLRDGEESGRAHALSLEKAEAVADSYQDDDRFGPKALNSLQRVKMSGVTDPYTGMPLEPGASRGDKVQKIPGSRGTHVSGTGHNVNGKRASMTSESQVRGQGASAPETYTFQSVDGNEYTFGKKLGGRPVDGFLPALNFIAKVEELKGGSAATVYHAAGCRLQDANGQDLLMPWDEMGGEEGQSDLPAGLSL